MDNRFEFNIEFDKDFHITIEKSEEDIPEPINEDYAIIELENNQENGSGGNIIELENDLQEEIKEISQNKINNLDDNGINNFLNNLNFTLDGNIKNKEGLLNTLDSEFSNILDQKLIIDHIDSIINSEISSKLDKVDGFKDYKYNLNKK